MKTKQNTSSGKRTIIAPSGIVLFIVILFWILGGQKSFAQGVGISEASITPDTWSILELRSNLRGFLAPRMTTAERTTLGSKPPTAGMLVYDTDTKSFWYYDGAWIAISGGSSVLGVANGGTGLSSITANNLLYGNGTSALSLLAPGGTTGAILMNTAGGAPSWSLLSGLPSTAGILPVANGGTGSNTLNFWILTGNAGTTGTAGTNFIGTTDAQDLVFKANSTERARIETATGDLKIGDATSGTIKATKELVLRQDGDVYGPSILHLMNRNTMNGAIFETTDPTYTLVDFIFKTNAVQRNIRFEARGAGMAKTGIPSFHIGGAVADIPTLSVGDNYAAVYNRFKVGDFNFPTALLQLAPGTATAGTAPLKFTSGPLLSAAEPGAIEFLSNNYYGTITTGAARKTFAFLESPAFTGTVTTPTINMSATSNQLVLQSAGVTGTLTWTPTASNKTIIFPDASGTVALVNAGANWLVGGNIGPGPLVLGSTDNSGINIQSGTGTINLGTDAFAKTINIGNTTGVTALNLTAGSGALNLNASNNQATNINTGSSTGTVTIGGASANQAVTIISGGTGTLNLNNNTGAASPVNIGTGTSTGTVTIGNTTGSVVIPDGVMLDLSQINNSSTSEGLKLPQSIDNSAATAEGQIAWNSSTDILSVGTGSVSQNIGIPNNMQAFTSNGTWNRPAGVSKVWVKVWGGGGAGRTSASANTGGGGGGGGYSEGVVSVTGNVTVTVGSGGLINGTAGQLSSFAGVTTVLANGGSGASGANPSVGGAGGTLTGALGAIKIQGGTGGNGASVDGAGGGSGGGSPFGGAGGPGGVGGNNGTINVAGKAGTIPGGGGGGGSDNTAVFGAGTVGCVIVYW